MALNETSKEFISLKKLQGKAHTSNNKDLANEALSTGLTVSSNTIFSSDIPASPTSTHFAISGGSVQFVRLSASFINGSDTVAGRHAFQLSLPDDFETPSGATNNLGKKGSGVFVDGQVVNTTKGALQLVPPSYGDAYEAKPFKYVDGTGDPTQIPVLDARDWYIDYFNGILFQQDPPGTGDHADNPRLVDAYIYVGDFVSDTLAGSSGDGDKGAEYIVLSATGSLSNERVLTPGTGLDLTDGGAGGNLTLDVDISEFSDVQIASGDKLLVLDSDNATHQLESIDDIATLFAGTGLSASSAVLGVDLNELTSADVDVASDSIAIVDATDNSTKKETIADIMTSVAGPGLAATSGVLNVNVDDSSIEVDTDTLRLKDSGVTLAKMADVANLKVLGNVSGGTAAPSAVDIDTDLSSVSSSHNSLASAKSVKEYVDSQIAGLDVKASVSAATTASFTMASTASSSTLVLADGEGGFDATADTLTIDGVSLSEGDRVLIKDGVNSNSAGVNNKWNGVYTVGALNGSELTLTRASDFDAGSEFTGAPFFMVGKGTDNGAHGFVSNLSSSPTIGTDPITFYQFSAPGQDSVAGAGLSMSGNVLSVDIDELTALGGASIDQADNFILSDAGTEKKVTFSNLEDAIFANVSGDATIAAGGALTIEANAIEDGMINDNVATGLAGDGLSASSGVMNVDVSDFAGAGLEDDGSENLRLNIDGLAADSNAGNLSDSIAIADASDSNLTKKITLTQLKTRS